MTTVSEKRYMARVAELGCIICGGPAELHHPTGQGMWLRAKNTDVIPLCHPHHRTGGYGVAVHAGTKEWEKRYGTQWELVALVKEKLKESDEDGQVNY